MHLKLAVLILATFTVANAEYVDDMHSVVGLSRLVQPLSFRRITDLSKMDTMYIIVEAGVPEDYEEMVVTVKKNSVEMRKKVSHVSNSIQKFCELYRSLTVNMDDAALTTVDCSAIYNESFNKYTDAFKDLSCSSYLLTAFSVFLASLTGRFLATALDWCYKQAKLWHQIRKETNNSV